MKKKKDRTLLSQLTVKGSSDYKAASQTLLHHIEEELAVLSLRYSRHMLLSMVATAGGIHWLAYGIRRS